jgi:predicted HTH transcriptional regulator
MPNKIKISRSELKRILTPVSVDDAIHRLVSKYASFKEFFEFAIVKIIEKGGFITREEVQNKFKISRRQAKYKLDRLIDLKLLVCKINSDKKPIYYPVTNKGKKLPEIFKYYEYIENAKKYK